MKIHCNIIICLCVFFGLIHSSKVRKDDNHLNISKELHFRLLSDEDILSLHNDPLSDEEILIDYGELMDTDSMIDEIAEERLHHQMYRREYPKRGYTEELKKKMLDDHNLYRSNITPPASNMEFMVKFPTFLLS
ncbi:hypothetical protein NPIL_496631 [Nephila pilipes]|uniref:Spider venom protein n=1 Tax=Nephila pilipes TaxID=299642 RepID=A0A8X6MY27_NEPPI|nr:hypothetical protein NPIL_496631 [Nephila pilipes]